MDCLTVKQEILATGLMPQYTSNCYCSHSPTLLIKSHQVCPKRNVVLREKVLPARTRFVNEVIALIRLMVSVCDVLPIRSFRCSWSRPSGPPAEPHAEDLMALTTKLLLVRRWMIGKR